MDIGLISDIHGDVQALEQTLYRLDTIHQVDDILCAGDLIGRGPQQDAVTGIIRRRDIPTVRGNHDEYAYGLNKENTAFLKGLPLHWRGSYRGVRVFMCHGKPKNNMWGLYRDHLSDTLANMMLKSLNADVLITGHTHVPMYMRVDAGCIVNPGSLYTFKNQRTTSHTYAVLHLPEMTLDVYDVNAPEPVRPLALD